MPTQIGPTGQLDLWEPHGSAGTVARCTSMSGFRMRPLDEGLQYRGIAMRRVSASSLDSSENRASTSPSTSIAPEEMRAIAQGRCSRNGNVPVTQISRL